MNRDPIIVHEYLHPGGWCDCGDGPFTQTQWFEHRGPLPEMAPPPPVEYEPMPPWPCVSDVVYGYLKDFWPDKTESDMTLRARADSIQNRIAACLRPSNV